MGFLHARGKIAVRIVRVYARLEKREWGKRYAGIDAIVYRRNDRADTTPAITRGSRRVNATTTVISDHTRNLTTSRNSAEVLRETQGASL